MTTAAGTELRMPRLTDSMEEGTILRWIKAPGDTLAVGDELVEIETDKATMAYEADVAGTLLETLAVEGEAVAVGAPIARVGDRAQAAPSIDAKRIKVSPLARRIAKERGIDLTQVAGSGPGGRIVRADVEVVAKPAAAAVPRSEAAASPAAVAPPAAVATTETSRGAVEVVEPTRLQQTVARRMTEAKATIPHIHLSAEVDMSRCVQARAALKRNARDGEPVPSYNDMVVKASALALRDVPRANGSWRDDRFELYSRVNVGIAVAAADALVVPTIFDADRKGLRAIASESRALAARVRDGAITPPELADATFTVSNLGMYGIDSFEAVINPPQAAILAVGAIADTPVARDGELAIAPTLRLTLACDHRILYGADGAELLARIRVLLEEPVALAG